MEIPSVVRAHACKQQAVSQGMCFRGRKLCSMTEILPEAGGEQEADSMQRSHDSMCTSASAQGHQEKRRG